MARRVNREQSKRFDDHEGVERVTTMADVAQDAGVSLSTVSYVLSGVRPVSEETKRRVHASIERLDFRRNSSAASLASKRTYVMAVLYPALSAGVSLTAAKIIAAAEERAREAGYQLVIWPQSDADSVVELARQGRADAVLVMEVSTHDLRVERLRAANIPVALIGRTGNVEGLACVDVDFDATLAAALDHLGHHGHRRIALINHPRLRLGQEYGAGRLASEAFERLCAERRLEGLVVETEDSRRGGEHAFDRICSEGPGTTALVVMNEQALFGVLASAHHRGLDVPTHLSIVSIVTSAELSESVDPPLTSLEMRADDMGRRGVELLLSVIADPAAQGVHLVPCELVERASVSPHE